MGSSVSGYSPDEGGLLALPKPSSAGDAIPCTSMNKTAGAGLHSPAGSPEGRTLWWGLGAKPLIGRQPEKNQGFIF